MQQFLYNLDKANNKPIILLNKPNNLKVLLDTGADFPVWTSGLNLLNKLYTPEFILSNQSFGGFGGTASGDVYHIHFTLNDKIIFPNLPTICHDMPNTAFNMILSSSMLYGLIYGINTKSSNLSIEVPDEESVIINKKIGKDASGFKIYCSNSEINTKSILTKQKTPINCLYDEEARNVAAAFRNYYNTEKEKF